VKCVEKQNRHERESPEQGTKQGAAQEPVCSPWHSNATSKFADQRSINKMGRGTRVYIGHLSPRIRERDLDYEFSRYTLPRLRPLAAFLYSEWVACVAAVPRVLCQSSATQLEKVGCHQAGCQLICREEQCRGRAAAEGFSPTSPRAHWIGPELCGCSNSSCCCVLSLLKTATKQTKLNKTKHVKQRCYGLCRPCQLLCNQKMVCNGCCVINRGCVMGTSN